MTPTELQDLDEMKAAVITEQIRLWQRLDHFSRMTPDELGHAGYRGYSIADAVLDVFARSQREVKRLHRAYLTKYPD